MSSCLVNSLPLKSHTRWKRGNTSVPGVAVAIFDVMTQPSRTTYVLVPHSQPDMTLPVWYFEPCLAYSEHVLNQYNTRSNSMLSLFVVFQGL